MRTRIIETGEINTLTLIDPKSRIEYTVDLMGNYSIELNYNDEINAYEISLEDFHWWKNLTSELQMAENRRFEVEKNLTDPDLLFLFGEDLESFGEDLEYLPSYINDLCEKYEVYID